MVRFDSAGAVVVVAIVDIVAKMALRVSAHVKAFEGMAGHSGCDLSQHADC